MNAPTSPLLNTTAAPATPDRIAVHPSVEQARATFHRFIELAKAPHEVASVKLLLSDGRAKAYHVWTDVLAVNSDTEFDVRPIISMPSPNGRPQRRWTLCVQDIEDWQLRTRSGEVHGGFTLRAGAR